MLHQLPYAIDFRRWETVAALAAGLATFALLLLLSRLLARRRERLGRSAKPAGSVPSPTLALPGVGDERRSAPRQCSSPIRVLLSDADFQSEPFEGWVVDCSIDGLGVSAVQPVAAGSLLGVRPPYPADAPWAVVEVRHCQPHERRWLLGCRFQNTPPWELLVLFGIVR
jgi:hypothetical protein